MNTSDTATAHSARPTFEGVQVLRVIAALLVVITHSSFYTHERLNPEMQIWRTGAIGVDIFFIISGFVMMATARSFTSAPGGWKLFASRRLLRIVPMYWLATTVKLVTMLLIPSMILHANLSPWTIFSSYTFLPSTNIDGRFEPLLGVGWTLIFEMFFYATFTIGLFLRVNVITFVSAVMSTCFLVSFFRTPDWNAATMYFNPIVMYFPIGMLMFELSQRVSRVTLQTSALIATILALFAFLNLEFDVKSGAANLATVATSCLVVFVTISAEPLLRGRLPKLLLFLGEASYVLYLFHPLVAPIVPEVLRRIYPTIPAEISVALCIVTAVLTAALIHSAIERPVTHWLKARSSAAPAPQGASS